MGTSKIENRIATAILDQAFKMSEGRSGTSKKDKRVIKVGKSGSN